MSRIRIVEQDGDVVEIEVQAKAGLITVITSMTKEGEDLVLRGLHMEGQGPGSARIRELRELAREFGRQQGAKRIHIYGGVRTTGAKRGHKPRPIIIRVEEAD